MVEADNIQSRSVAFSRHGLACRGYLRRPSEASRVDALYRDSFFYNAPSSLSHEAKEYKVQAQ
jgi:hypothetical protein